MQDIDEIESCPHQFIAIEGPIGVGKTSLTQLLAKRFDYDTLLEQAEENPFLDRFYQNPKQYALATQLFFLFQRSQQLESLPGEDLFAQPMVSDFLIAKDPLFAELNLDNDELALYKKVYNQLTINTPTPDLVIYLQAPETVLIERIFNRGIKSEKTIDPSYLKRLNEAYSRYFHFYDASPLLIINAEQIDFVNNKDHLQQIIQFAKTITRGRHYLNPSMFT